MLVCGQNERERSHGDEEILRNAIDRLQQLVTDIFVF